MRRVALCALGLSVSLAMLGIARAQKAPAPAVMAVPAAATPSLAAVPIPALAVPTAPPACAGNPNALGVARVVEVDTTGGPGFGFEHFKMHNFLRLNEVVLTFDDGPWPNNTPAVLKALAAHCAKATFFPIGKHATYYPDILRDVAAQGHTIGSHTWSHADLSKKSAAEAKDEIEKGVSAGRAVLPFSQPEASARAGHLSGRAQCRHFLHRYGLVRLQDAQARTGHRLRHGQAEEARQRHRAAARFSVCHRRGAAGAFEPTQGERLQDRPYESQRSAAESRGIRRADRQGAEAADRQHQADRRRRTHDQRRMNNPSP